MAFTGRSGSMANRATKTDANRMFSVCWTCIVYSVILQNLKRRVADTNLYPCMAIIRAIVSVRESRDPGFMYYLRSSGNSVVVVASATAGGNSICVAQLPPDIWCQ